MFYWIIPLSIGTILLTIFLIFRGRGDRKKAVIVKGFTSLAFIITALVAWKCSSNPNSLFGVFVILGLVFGLFGDIVLDLKFILTKYDFPLTVAGFMVFLIGHVFYIIGLFVVFYNWSASILYLIIPLIVGVVLSIITLLMENFGMVKYGKMKPFVPIYAVSLFFDVAIYFSVAIQSGWQITTVNIMAISLVSFAISDLILNNTYFATGFDKPVHIVTNHLFYYVAQFAIAVSLFFLI